MPAPHPRAFAGAFSLTQLERVLSGRGAVAALASEVDRYGCRRVAVVTGRTLGASALVSGLVERLGDRCVRVFAGARQHVPESSVDALAAALREAGADGIVSVGGGSPIDTAKAAVHQLVRGADSRAAPVHIAVPTTLSAGEFTAVAGVTGDATRVKRAVADRRLAPRTVILDPEVTVLTPERLWLASGLRALDHAVETIEAQRCHPLGEAAASKAIALLADHLPASISGAEDDRLEHRAHCQMAAWLSIVGLPNAGLGLSHALGHQIGPRWEVSHGVTSAVMLPHAMRFVARRAPTRFASIAASLGVPFDASRPQGGAMACADAVAALVARLGLPGRLSEAGVPRADLGSIAPVVARALAEASSFDPPVTIADIEALLAAAY